MSVSSRERAFMRRIGASKAASHAEALRKHRAAPLAERLRRSWSLYVSTRASARVADDDPSPFYARARARGLYRP